MNDIHKFNTIDEYNKAMGVETLHPLVSVIDFSKATYQDRLPDGQIAFELGFGYPQIF